MTHYRERALITSTLNTITEGTGNGPHHNTGNLTQACRMGTVNGQNCATCKCTCMYIC